MQIYGIAKKMIYKIKPTFNILINKSD